MTVSRPHAVTATDLFLRLLLDEVEAQGEVLRRILARLPEPVRVEQKLVMTPRQREATGEGQGGPVEVTEPAPPSAPVDAQPVTEPALPAGPAEARPVSEPAPKRAPRRDDDGTSVPPPPPRSGKGSGVEAWRSFANLAGVKVPADASRDDIIAACERARVIDAE